MLTTPYPSFQPWPTLFPVNPPRFLALLLLFSPILLPILFFTWPLLALFTFYAYYTTHTNTYGPYTLHSVPWNDITDYLQPGNATNAPGLPSSLHGIWQMSGNPLPDGVMTFAGGEWGENRTYRIKVYETNQWSWHWDMFGRFLYSQSEKRRLVYEARFDESYTYADVVPYATMPVLGRCRVSPKLCCFTLRKREEGVWVRESWFFGVRMWDYLLVRVVDGEGRKVEGEWEKRTKSDLGWRRQAVARRIKKV